jgi:hypothetical protein
VKHKTAIAQTSSQRKPKGIQSSQMQEYKTQNEIKHLANYPKASLRRNAIREDLTELLDNETGSGAVVDRILRIHCLITYQKNNGLFSNKEK